MLTYFRFFVTQKRVFAKGSCEGGRSAASRCLAGGKRVVTKATISGLSRSGKTRRQCAEPEVRTPVPRVRSANFGFKGALGTYTRSCPFDSEVRIGGCRKVLRTSELGR